MTPDLRAFGRSSSPLGTRFSGFRVCVGLLCLFQRLLIWIRVRIRVWIRFYVFYNVLVYKCFLKLEFKPFGTCSRVLKLIKIQELHVFDVALFYYSFWKMSVLWSGENVALYLVYVVFITVSWKLIWELLEGFKFAMLLCCTCFLFMISVHVTF